MKVLIVGSGGREHALAWKISQSPKVDELYCAPGNAGTARLAINLPVCAEDIGGVINIVESLDIDLTVIGPEAPLALGLSDQLRAKNRAVFAPSQAAAAIESSKEIAKELMLKYRIPTAEYQAFSDYAAAEKYIREKGAPIVVKADGLAAGKGVIVALDQKEALAAAREMLLDKTFGQAGQRIVVEQFLEGEEVSILAFCDGKHIVPMVSAQDHKRAFDGDRGPNTGGMGAYSPAPVYTKELAEIVEQEILWPTLRALESEGRAYHGVLYAGLMVTKDGPKVLEYNARFGDPETQAVLVRLKTDLIDVIEAILAGRLDRVKIEWYDEAAVCVVIASGGYPGAYEKGKVIHGIEEAESFGVQVFHAGTAIRDNEVVSAGGRVLGVTGKGKDIAQAIEKTYRAAGLISFDQAFYRHDIGHRALNR